MAHFARFSATNRIPLAPDIPDFEAYIKQLELDRPMLEPIPGGTRIKFDRQTLMQPVEKFWSVMTAGLNRSA